MTGLEMKYFVLKPHGNDAHAKAARKAMRVYSIAIAKEDPKMGEQLWEWARREEQG